MEDLLQQLVTYIVYSWDAPWNTRDRASAAEAAKAVALLAGLTEIADAIRHHTDATVAAADAPWTTH